MEELFMLLNIHHKLHMAVCCKSQTFQDMPTLGFMQLPSFSSLKVEFVIDVFNLHALYTAYYWPLKDGLIFSHAG